MTKPYPLPEVEDTILELGYVDEHSLAYRLAIVFRDARRLLKDDEQYQPSHPAVNISGMPVFPYVYEAKKFNLQGSLDRAMHREGMQANSRYGGARRKHIWNFLHYAIAGYTETNLYYYNAQEINDDIGYEGAIGVLDWALGDLRSRTRSTDREGTASDPRDTMNRMGV